MKKIIKVVSMLVLTFGLLFASVAPAFAVTGPNKYTVTYASLPGGNMYAPTKEVVVEGKTPQYVPAVVAQYGYVFLGWHDENAELIDPASTEINSDRMFIAHFLKVNNNAGGINVPAFGTASSNFVPTVEVPVKTVSDTTKTAATKTLPSTGSIR